MEHVVAWLLCIFVGGLLLLYALGRLVFRHTRHPDQILFAPTDDDKRIAIWRFRPRGKANKTPLILQHGLGINHYNFDMDDRVSLARYMARAGYDVFCPDLRGCGLSRTRKWGAVDKWNIHFTDFVEHDLPAVFAAVEAETGAKKSHFIGHSMGGMIGCALAQGPLGNKMKSLATIAGPCFFEHMQQFRHLLRLRALMRFFVVIRFWIFTTMAAPLVRFFPGLLGRRDFNPANVEGSMIAFAAVNAIEGLPRDLLTDFAGWVQRAEWGTADGVSWEEGLSKITVPIYCLGASKDFYCPPEANERVIDHVASKRKQYRMFSLANGDRADYGHGDLVVGRDAPDDVFPSLLDWLKQND